MQNKYFIIYNKIMINKKKHKARSQAGGAPPMDRYHPPGSVSLSDITRKGRGFSEKFDKPPPAIAISWPRKLFSWIQYITKKLTGVLMKGEKIVSQLIVFFWILLFLVWFILICIRMPGNNISVVENVCLGCFNFIIFAFILPVIACKAVRKIGDNNEHEKNNSLLGHLGAVLKYFFIIGIIFIPFILLILPYYIFVYYLFLVNDSLADKMKMPGVYIILACISAGIVLFKFCIRKICQFSIFRKLCSGGGILRILNELLNNLTELQAINLMVTLILLYAMHISVHYFLNRLLGDVGGNACAGGNIEENINFWPWFAFTLALLIILTCLTIFAGFATSFPRISNLFMGEVDKIATMVGDGGTGEVPPLE
jgi:hypothetical protein